jgi:hypothetical protein
MALAADANLLSLYMGFEWRFRLSFALPLLTTTSVQKLDLIDSLQGRDFTSDTLQACAQLWTHFNLSLLPLLDG